MESTSLLFIPYQDTDNFYEDGILTREFAILLLLHNMGFTNITNVKKPRTLLDKRRYQTNVNYYPDGSTEGKVKEICDKAKTIQYLPPFKFSQIVRRRNWWLEGYEKTISLIPWDKVKNGLVYSDNPYAVNLLEVCKQKGMTVYFDVMDNFAIHPSLSPEEQAGALEAYKKVLSFADIVSANSAQTCDFMKEKTTREPFLVKNGVFSPEEAANKIKLPFSEELNILKNKYKNCVGYIGKLGLRIDANLVEQIADACPDTLFVFVGPFLKGQVSEKLQELISSKSNIVHFDAIPSAFVYPTIEEFDICMLPHSVGKAENGGDPLKLYQYMITNKPIITTSILGVQEFADVIKISDDQSEWVEYINRGHSSIKRNVDDFSWKNRFSPIEEEIRERIRQKE